MNENGTGLLQKRILDLWENTDFTSTLFGSLTGYAAFTKALGMFTPFVGPLPTPVDPSAPNARAEKADLDELKTQLSEMQRRLDSLVAEEPKPKD